MVVVSTGYQHNSSKFAVHMFRKGTGAMGTIGGIIGFAIGGVIGGIIGLVIGGAIGVTAVCISDDPVITCWCYYWWCYRWWCYRYRCCYV